MRKIISVFLAVSLFVSAFATSSSAKVPWKEIFDVFIRCIDHSLSCTDDTYYVYTPEDLQWISEECYNGNTFYNQKIVLKKDIDMKNVDFYPIGVGGESVFLGEFDGNNKKIKNLVISADCCDYVGLFGMAGEYAYIHDVKIGRGSEIYGCGYVGSIVGYNYKGNICNCENKACVFGNEFVGGIVGCNRLGTVECNINGGPVSIYYNYGGGVVGYNDEGKVNYCVNEVRITTCANYIGSIVGYNNYGSVMCNSGFASVICYGYHSNGYVGYNNNGTVI